jgi:hypothetical protein
MHIPLLLLLLLAHELVSASPYRREFSNGGLLHHRQNYPIPPAAAVKATSLSSSSTDVIPCPGPKDTIAFTLDNWQNHTHEEEQTDTISFHLSTSFDDLSTFCHGDFFEGNGETPCLYNSSRYNTSFGLTNTVAAGGYVYINHLFRCLLARNNYRKRFRIVEAWTWVNIPLRDVPDVGTSRRYGVELKLYLNTTGVAG